MLSKLRQGITLVVDRYSFSGAVFTAAKQIPGLNLEWCKVLPSLPQCVSTLNLEKKDLSLPLQMVSRSQRSNHLSSFQGKGVNVALTQDHGD